MPAVGRNVLRKEGSEKVTGAAKYVDDLAFPGMLHGRTVRSTIPRGEIAKVRLGFDRDGFTVVDCSTVVATHLSHLMQVNAGKLLGRVETQSLVEHVTKLAELAN